MTLSEAQLNEYIAQHPADPNVIAPPRALYRMVAEQELEQRSQRAVQEQRRLGVDQLRRQVAELHAEIADLRRHISALQRFKADIVAATGTALGQVRGEIEKRIGALESKQLRFAGIYQKGEVYETNDLVLKGGKLWICKTGTDLPPGGNNNWQMILRPETVSEIG